VADDEMAGPVESGAGSIEPRRLGPEAEAAGVVAGDAQGETVTGEDDPAALPPPEVVAAAANLTEGGTPDVRPEDAWAEAGRKVLRFHLARMLARVPGVIAGEDPEEVHRMRVAARRMRAAWRVFGDGFERSERRRYRSELRDIGAALGVVRDLDVLIEILVSDAQRHSSRQRAGLEPLLAAWRADRMAGHAALVETLRSERFAAFAVDYERLVDTPGHAAVAIDPHRPGLVRNRMPATIWQAYELVWAFDDDLEPLDLVTLHRLRIAAKWLRYTIEFVRDPLEPGATALIRPVVALQDLLGAQHDRHVATSLAREFAGSAPLSAVEARSTAKFIERLEGGVERAGRTFAAAWRPIVAPDYRRALGRTVARL
jgi:CHAD domain-containing protein